MTKESLKRGNILNDKIYELERHYAEFCVNEDKELIIHFKEIRYSNTYDPDPEFEPISPSEYLKKYSENVQAKINQYKEEFKNLK